MFDHVKFGVSDFAASKAFFLSALEPLGASMDLLSHMLLFGVPIAVSASKTVLARRAW
jgi:catechol 2,3-dioxygenase-like lactoylglutathione lyase family enzyme